MNDIKFKAKRKDNEEWVEGYFLKLCNYSTCSWNEGIEYRTDKGGKFAYDVTEIDPKTLCRYIGVNDKNNKAIYEGDIIKTKYGRLGVVTWLSSSCYCGWDIEFYLYENNHQTNPPDKRDLWLSDNIEVVGNIHDTPQLSQEYMDFKDAVNDAVDFLLGRNKDGE